MRLFRIRAFVIGTLCRERRRDSDRACNPFTYVDHSRLLNGVAASGSRFTAFSSDCLQSALTFRRLMASHLPQDDVHIPAPGVVGIDVPHKICYHRTNVDPQWSKFVVNLASVAHQIHRRPLPPIPRITPVSGERVAPTRCSRPADRGSN
jgi:hypothetical protein